MSPPPPSTTHPVPVTIEQGVRIVEANNWIQSTQLDQVKRETLAVNTGADARALLARLMEANLLTKSQGSELKSLILHQSTLPQFQFLKKIGAGGMGTVFLVRDGVGGSLLALKTINARLQGYEDFAGRFERETTALAGITHENIAAVKSSGESHGMCFMAMEYIDGPSLFGLLEEAKALPESYVLSIGLQVAEGLAHVWNAAKLVHRDIKPENVLVVRTKKSLDPYPSTDVAKLIDFGLVKPSRDHDEIRLTQTGMTIGTPLYMSPEQIRGEDLDCRSDIYGLTATMYHLLTGVTPFAGKSPGEIMSAHLTQVAPDPNSRVPSLNPMTRQLIMTGMAKKVTERFNDYSALIHAIQKALSEISTRQGSSPKLLRKPLVLKTPTRKAQTDLTPSTPAVELPDVSLQTEPVSSRIIDKHKNKSESARSTSIARVLPALSANPKVVLKDSNPRDSASENLRRIRTDRFKILKKSIHKDPPTSKKYASQLVPSEALGPITPSAPQPKSAIFHEDPKRSVGIGMMPWVVLACAAILLLVYCLLPI